MRLKYVVALLILLNVNLGMAAQETTGTVKGRLTDIQGLGVPGATVTVTGAQGVKDATTDSEGRFNVPFLTPGSYTVRAELQGFKPVEQRVSVSLGQTVDLPIKMEVGGVTEKVDVTQITGNLDLTSTTTGAVISTDMTAQLPVGRRVSDVMLMAPGVSSGGSVGTANPSMSGGTGLENQYVIDGVNVTNMGYGALGSYSIVFGSLGNATPYDFIKEVQVKTGGYEAEFGQSTGGIANVITKSGTNEIRGSAFGYARPSKLESTWTQFFATNGSVNTLGSSTNDIGAEGGGPIMKNHAFFFGAIDPSWDKRTMLPPPGFPLASVFPNGVDRDRRTVPYSLKGTVQLTGNQRIDASFFGDPSHGNTGPQRTTALIRPTTSGFSTLDYGGHNQTVRYNGVLSGRWLVEATYARAVNTISELPSVNTWAVRDTTVTPNITSGGIGFYEAGNHSLNNQYAVSTAYIAGAHQIKAGFQYDDVDYDLSRNYTGPTFTAPNGQQTSTGASISIVPDPTYGEIFRVTRANFNVQRTTLQKYQNFYAQDTWKVGDRLTVNPGIRYEQEKLVGQIITNWTLKNNWAPRIGATYDPIGDAKSKIYGNFGIFYARIPNDLAARALSSDNGFTRGDYFDAGLTKPVPEGTLAAGVTRHFILAGVGADTIDSNAKLSYIREFVIGFEREVLPYTSIGVRWIDRRMPRIVEDVANCPMAAYDLNADTGAICNTVDYILTNPTNKTPINPALLAVAPVFNSVSFDTPVHKYDAVEITLNRRLSNRWSAQASYRYSRLRGNFEGFYRDDNGQSDPGISSLYDFPTNDPTYTSLGSQFGYPGDIRFLGDPNGILPLDRPHQIKLFGNYLFPFGLNVGVGINAVSGKPLTALAPNPNYGNGGEIPTTPRGAGIQTIDGFKTRTPFQSQIDLQAAYQLKVGGNRQLSLVADIFNVFDQQIKLDYDTWTALTYGADPNVDYGKPVSQNFGGLPPQIQTPRQIRVGVRFAF